MCHSHGGICRAEHRKEGQGRDHKDNVLWQVTLCLLPNHRLQRLYAMLTIYCGSTEQGLCWERHRPVPELVPAQSHSPLFLQQRAEDLKEFFNETLNVVTARTGHEGR